MGWLSAVGAVGEDGAEVELVVSCWKFVRIAVDICSVMAVDVAGSAPLQSPVISFLLTSGAVRVTYNNCVRQYTRH